MFGFGISIHLLMLPVIAFVQSLLILGIVFILSAVNVYVQDMEYIVTFILNMLFYGTPVLYELSMFGDAGILYKLISLNPLTTIINSYRDIFMNHVLPDMSSLGLVFLLAIVVLLVGYKIFKVLEKGFAEEL